MIKTKTLTLHPERRMGYFIQTDVYNEIKKFILEILEMDKSVLLNDLIERAKHKGVLSVSDNLNLNWYLLIVKLDLEARGFLTCSIIAGHERKQVIKINRRTTKFYA